MWLFKSIRCPGPSDKVSWACPGPSCAALFKSIRCPGPSCAALLQRVYHEGGTSGQLDRRRWAGGQQGKYAGTPLLSVAILSKGLEMSVFTNVFLFFTVVFSLSTVLLFSIPHIIFSLPVINFSLHPPQIFSTYPILPQSERVLYSAVTYTLSGCLNVLCNWPIPAH